MKCKAKIKNETIDDYTEGILNDEEMQKLEEHFIDCEECITKLYIRRKTTTVFKSEQFKRNLDKYHTFVTQKFSTQEKKKTSKKSDK